MAKIDAIREQQAKLKERLDELKKAEARELAEAKARRRKSDNKTKLLIGVAVVAAARGMDDRSQTNKHALLKLINTWLNEKDRQAVLTSSLWKELAHQQEGGAEAPPRDSTPLSGAEEACRPLEPQNKG